MFSQEGYQDDSLFVCLGEYTRSAFVLVLKQVFDEWLIHILWLMACHFYPTFFFSHGDDWRTFYSFIDSFQEPVGKIHRMARTAVILGHFDKCTSGFLRQPVHIIRIGTSEFIDVLVIVSHCYHTHFFIVGHQSLYKCVFFCSHVLGFVYNQYCLTDFVRFYFFLTYHLGCLWNDILWIFKISYPSQEIEAIGVECFYFDKMGCIAYQLHKPLFELRSGCPWKCQHQ